MYAALSDIVTFLPLKDEDEFIEDMQSTWDTQPAQEFWARFQAGIAALRLARGEA